MAPDKKGALKRNATLVFWDESGISEQPTVRRTWAARGRTPILRTTGNRWSARSILGMIACRPDGSKPRLVFRIAARTVNTEEIVRTLAHLRRHTRGAVLLLWDNLSSHRSGGALRELRRSRPWLAAERFPAYAPELNPVEAFWSALKRKDLGNACPDGLPDLDRRIRRGVRRLRRRTDVLAGCLRASGLFQDDA